MKKFLKRWVVTLGIALTGVNAVAEQLPADEDLADLYEYSCMACHTKADSGAPLTGDQQAWAPRIKKGEDVLLDNTINGFKGMPALGSCQDCTAEDFIELITFMSSGN